MRSKSDLTVDCQRNEQYFIQHNIDKGWKIKKNIILVLTLQKVCTQHIGIIMTRRKMLFDHTELYKQFI